MKTAQSYAGTSGAVERFPFDSAVHLLVISLTDPGGKKWLNQLRFVDLRRSTAHNRVSESLDFDVIMEIKSNSVHVQEPKKALCEIEPRSPAAISIS